MDRQTKREWMNRYQKHQKRENDAFMILCETHTTGNSNCNMSDLRRSYGKEVTDDDKPEDIRKRCIRTLIEGVQLYREISSAIETIPVEHSEAILYLRRHYLQCIRWEDVAPNRCYKTIYLKVAAAIDAMTIPARSEV